MEPKILFFDIETSNLKANIGRLLAFGYKWAHEPRAEVTAMSDFPGWKRDTTDDRHVVIKAYDVITQADLVVGHYSQRFDWKFLQTRLLAHSFPALPQIPHVDTWRIAKDRLALHSNRLASLTQLLGLPSKTEILWDDWVRAISGNADSMERIREHCRVDVEVLEQAYLRLRPWIVNHPNLAALLGDNRATCPACTSNRTMKNGTRVTLKKLYQRWQCKTCGNGWSELPRKEKENANL